MFKRLLLASLLFVSCTDHYRVKIVDQDAQKSVEAIIKDLDPEQKEEFMSAYTNILILGSRGNKGKESVVMIMNKKYEDITLGDILEMVTE